MSQLDKDIESARGWLIDIAIDLARVGLKYQDQADAFIRKMQVVTACAQLPGDMPLRVRCMPEVFTLKA